MPLAEFTRQDRERVMELLLSQERVISLLYDRTFVTTREAGSPLSAREGSAGQGAPARLLPAVGTGTPTAGPASARGSTGDAAETAALLRELELSRAAASPQ